LFDNNGWREEASKTITGMHEGHEFTFSSKGVDEHHFSGRNLNIGFLWNLNNTISIGAVIKTPFQADLKVESNYSSSIVFPDQPDTNIDISDTSTEYKTLDMPMSYGIGLSYRFTDSFSASSDIYRTEWSDYILTDEDGNKISPITGKLSSESNIDPTHQVRLGTEYLIISKRHIIPLRGGIFYDPAPSEGNPDDFYGFRLGSGIVWKSFVFDAAYQYRIGNDVNDHNLKELDFSQDVTEHSFYGSVIIHF